MIISSAHFPVATVALAVLRATVARPTEFARTKTGSMHAFYNWHAFELAMDAIVEHPARLAGFAFWLISRDLPRRFVAAARPVAACAGSTIPLAPNHLEAAVPFPGDVGTRCRIRASTSGAPVARYERA